jgi:opacity protein-like surface antigen
MVVGHGGFASAGSGETVAGDGIELGVAVSVRPLAGVPRILVEAGFAAFRDPRHDLSPNSSKEMSAQLVVGRAAYAFRRTDASVRPYVFGGLAVVRVDFESQCVDCVFDIDPATGRRTSRGTLIERIDDTKAGFTLGAGVDIRVSRAVVLRPEWSLSSTTPGSGWNWGWAAVRMGFGYRF